MAPKKGKGRRRPEAVGWHFWRLAFWTRPALLLVAGVLAAGGTWFTGLMLADAITDSRALAAESYCPTTDEPHPTGGCLSVVHGELRGPFDRSRSSRVDWTLQIGDKRYYMSTAPGVVDALKLAQDPVEGVVRHGRLLALWAPGGWVRSESVGADGIVESLSFFGGLMMVALMAIRHAFMKADVLGGWWRSGSLEFAQLRASPVTYAAASIAVGFALMWFAWGAIGLGWRVSTACGIAGLLLCPAALVVGRIRRARQDAGNRAR